MRETSWDEFSSWYDQLVGEKGHYYHENVILPCLLDLLDLKASPKVALLDLGCGQGVLERALPKTVEYLGIDLSPALIKAAQVKAKNKHHVFRVGDFTQPLDVKAAFTHAVFLLSLQNVENQGAAIGYAAEFLVPEGQLVIVLNHPCFRIPRQSSWGVDETKKLQYRRLDRYLSPLAIPIAMQHKEEKSSMSFHYPLSAYVDFLREAGLFVVAMQEWISDKKSQGAARRMEDRARQEFPLFLTIKAIKRG